ncbi:MAG TPA: alpha/beta fold hydrolase [Chitinophagales bacterium]|nr:alpha/beta fold hydrolase [Chitinophagales bacterium]
MYAPGSAPKPVVLFAHGFKGFKDWGHFNLLAERFAVEGFVFVKFNFSHNGTTPEHPADFVDLEAFGNNNFSIEMDDLGCVIDYVFSESEPARMGITDAQKLCLIGHSRGGGIVILKAHEDQRVKKIVTWAAVNDFGKYWSQQMMDDWRKQGVVYIENIRTRQQMPLYYQLAENYYANPERLHIPAAVKRLGIPFMIVHGTDDESVPYQSAIEMQQWNSQAKLLTVEGGSHTFGVKHPFEGTTLPADAEKVITETSRFLAF